MPHPPTETVQRSTRLACSFSGPRPFRCAFLTFRRLSHLVTCFPHSPPSFGPGPPRADVYGGDQSRVRREMDEKTGVPGHPSSGPPRATAASTRHCSGENTPQEGPLGKGGVRVPGPFRLCKGRSCRAWLSGAAWCLRSHAETQVAPGGGCSAYRGRGTWGSPVLLSRDRVQPRDSRTRSRASGSALEVRLSVCAAPPANLSAPPAWRGGWALP